VIDVVVEGRPVGKQRPRVGRTGTYTPRETVQYEERIAWTVKGKYPGLRVDKDHPWCLAVTVVLGDRRRRDLDNIVKSVMDGLNGVVWGDDDQVVKIKAAKQVHSGTWSTMITAWREA
jgi:Holliday junction resolvase RusA-like endonuclease